MSVILRDIDLVTWDVDGTLYDSSAMKQRVLLAALRHPLRALRELLPVRRFNWAVDQTRAAGGGLADLVVRMDRPRLLRMEIDWCAPAIGSAGPRPGLIAALDAVRARGLPQVAVSDYDPAYKLTALGVSDYFAAAYAGEQLGSVKPSPTSLLRAIETQGVEPRRVLHIGDGIATDAAAARAAGTRCVILGRDVRDMQHLAQQLAGD